ncbi:MAG: GWxTD domain-containing protein [Candidatus Eisenbacteria bacterium]
MILPLWPVLLLGGILPFGGPPDAFPFPLEADGDIHFALDAARFQGESGPITELYLSIPPEDLVVESDSLGSRSRILVDVRLADSDGDEIARAVDSLTIPAMPARGAEGELRPRHLLTLRPRMQIEAQRVTVRVEDLNGRKRGILDRLQGNRPASELTGRFSGDPSGCGVSDIAFAWQLERGRPTLRESIQANPLRRYGLFRTEMLFYVEGYGRRSEPLRYEILALPGKQVVASGADTSSTAIGDGGTEHWLARQDISFLPAGSYELEVRGEGSCRSSAEFQVLWAPDSWERTQQDLREEAYVLLGPSEYEKVQEMSRGEVEVYLRDLWARHDPDPSTGTNELREKFEERLAFANRFYGTSMRKGMLTDRGRVYIRYGPPDEISKELNPQYEDLLSQVLPQEVATDRVDVIRKPPPRALRDDAAYEIWTYQMRGDPLFPEQETPVQRTGLRFIFVDDLGYGEMRLIYTNLSGAF